MANALGGVQAGIGKVLPVDRANEPLNRLEPIVRHVIEWNYGSQRFAWVRIAEKGQLHGARRRWQVKADFVTLARGQRNVEGAALRRSNSRTLFDRKFGPNPWRYGQGRPIWLLCN
ncbi:hypothetical protein LB558_22060 [Mesorhizobium sp. CO1-1-8]|nr:hypothetical protein [Mesorhizobium sp. CO1-1-8]